MKNIRCYLPNVLLTFLLVFFVAGSQLTIFAKTQVLSKHTFQSIAEQEALADKAYTSLESYFQSRSNSTGIPAEVYTDVIDREMLHAAILDSVNQAFDYLNGKSDSYAFTIDFTEMHVSIEAFFSSYAEENGYQKDQVYEEKVASVIAEAEAKILFVTDTFKFSTMYEKGWLETAKTYISYLNLACTLCIAGAAVLFVLLILCNLKQPAHLLYWSGLAAGIPALLMLIPCAYITATDYFAGFAIKDPQIFAAVVGYLRHITSGVMTMEIVTLVIAVICFILFGFLSALQGKKKRQLKFE